MQKKKKIAIIVISAITLFVTFFACDYKFNDFKIISSFINLFTQNSNGPRKKYNFNYDWMFAKGEGYVNKGSIYGTDPVTTYSSVLASENPQNMSYSTILGDNRWSKVSLAHTFNDVDTFDNFMEPGYNAERSTYTGTSWYKKQFFVPASDAGKRIYIEFEAARQAADIYINGVKLNGKYENGFIPFGYDLTNYLVYGENNDITVMVDNSFPYKIEGTNSTVTWHNPHWHPNYGGLFRNSYLYVMDDLHFTLPLYSFLKTEGTYVYTSDEDGTNKTAIVHVDTQIENNDNQSKNFTVQAKVYDRENNDVLTIINNDVTLDAATCSDTIYTDESTCINNGGTWNTTKTTVQLSDTLENVIRWSTDYPYLYTVECEILQNSIVIDNNITELGIRTFRFTTDYGFYLNENYVEINGWGQKTTMEYAGLGAAYPDWLTDSIIKQMKNANGNYIRWGHVSGSPSQIKAADKYGILVTQPGVDGEGNTDGGYDSNSTKLRVEAFRDLIIYFRNNPSIIMWEMGNQSDSMSASLNSSYIDSIGGLSDFGKTSASMVEMLYFFANKYDYGNRQDAVSGSIPNVGTYDSTVGYSLSTRALTVRRVSSNTNNYLEVAEITNADSSGIAGKPSIEAEYNRDEARRGIWDTYTNDFTSQNDYHKTSQEYAKGQVISLFNVLQATSNSGGANWIFSDSISHGRINTEVARASGEVDATMLEKEAYYVDQVIFGDDVSSYIIGHWNYSIGTTKNVYAVSKGVSRLQMIVTPTVGDPVIYNGSNTFNYLWTFNNVVYQPGTISVIGYDEYGSVVNEASFSKTTHGVATGIKLTLINGNEGIRANGSDVVLVDVEVVDDNGNRCLTYDTGLNDLITFNLTGDTNKFIWRGGYNSGIPTNTNTYTLYSEAGITRVAIKTTLDTGSVILSATSANGLATINPLTISSTAVTNNDGTFTGVSEVQDTGTYDLSTQTDPGFGTGSKLGLVAVENNTISSVLIGSLSYGEEFDNNSRISDAFSTGKLLYSDELSTFTSVPYKYLNAEYLLLPNTHGANYVADMIVFNAKRDIDVFILRDPAVVEPVWLNNYTLTSDHIIGGNGVTYDIYKKSFNKGELITIGSNVDDQGDLNNGNNQIVMFKETEKVNSNTFFYEDFNDFDMDAVKQGWRLFNGANTNATASIEQAFSQTNSFKLYDTNSSAIAYVQKAFAPLTKFKLRFKAYISNIVGSNKWARVWLTSSSIIGDEDKSNLGIETYLDQNSNGLTVNNRVVSDSKTTQTIIDELEFDQWNSFEYNVDSFNHNYTISVNGSEPTGSQSFVVKSMSELSYLIFGTWKNGTTQGYYIDDVEIVPVIESVISDVTVDGNALTRFSDDDYSYYVSGLNDDSVINFTQGYYYDSHTLTYDNSSKKWILVVTDVLGDTWTYDFYNEYSDPIFENWTVLSSAGENHDDFTNLQIEPYVLNGVETIHLLDHSTNSMVYLQREINPVSSNYSISVDLYVPNNGLSNQNNKIWLLNGEMIDPLTTSNLGVSTYLDKIYESNQLYTRSEYNDEVVVSTNGYSLDEWHTYKIVVNENAKTYDVYVDDVLQYENAGYLTDVADLTHYLVGTDYAGQGQLYFANYNFQNIYPSPVTSIAYDGIEIADFNSEIYNYNVYTENKMTDDTIIDVTYRPDAQNSVVTKNLITQTIEISSTDPNGNVYTYIINVLNVNKMEISLQDLVALINHANNDFIGSDYSSTSWDRLQVYVNYGENIINPEITPNPSNEALAHAYYYINKNINDLVQVESLNFQNDVVGDTYVSNDLVNSIRTENVLENGDYVYYKDSYTNQDPVFRSIPMKYMNATYFVFANQLHATDGEVKFKAKRDVSVLILKDRNAGAIIDSGYIDTKEIVTATYMDGDVEKTIVYKVYRKDYNEGSVISLNSKTILNNRITNFQNIVAIKDLNDVTNNKFWCDITSRYNNLEDFMYSWGVYDTDDYDTMDYDWNYHAFETNVKSTGFTALRLVSTAGNKTPSGLTPSFAKYTTAPYRSMSELYRQFAKMYGKFYISYYAYAPTTSDITVSSDKTLNRYLRLWITRDSPALWEPTSTAVLHNSATCDVKTHNLVETYLSHPNNTYTGFGLYYRQKGDTSDRTIKTNVPMDAWTNEIGYEVNVRNKNFFAYYGGYQDSNKINTAAYGFVVDSYTGSDNYADYMLFGTRGTGKSDYYFRDLCVTPINEDILTDIIVNGSNVSDYISISKDYLYSASDLTNKNVVLESGTIHNASVDVNNSISITEGDNTISTYNDITVTSNTAEPYTMNHRIYYEIDKNRKSITEAIENVLDLNEDSYTVESWSNLVIKLSNATDLLDEPEATVNNIDIADIELRNAISELEKNSTFNDHYVGTLARGNNLTNPIEEDIYITNDSSITMNATLNAFVGTDYLFIPQNRVKKLISNTVLPEGTKITLIDDSFDIPYYYYYIVSATDVGDLKKEYLLSDFIKMGTNDNFGYPIYFNSTTGFINVDWKFIVDYKDATTKLSDGIYTLKVNVVSSGEIIDMEPLTYHINNNNGVTDFSISSDKDSYYVNEDISIDLYGHHNLATIDGATIYNTNRDNKKLGVEFTLYQDGNLIAMPLNTIISSNDSSCSVLDNKCILTLGNTILGINRIVTLNFGLNNNLNSGTYTIRARLIRSFDGINMGEVIASNDILVLINNDSETAFRAELDNSKVNIIKYPNSYTLKYNFLKVNVSNPNIVVSLYKKNGNDYDIVNLTNYITNTNLLTNYDTNKYSLGNVNAFSPIIKNGIDMGTYKLVFDLYSASSYKTSIEKYFIVKE